MRLHATTRVAFTLRYMQISSPNYMRTHVGLGLGFFIRPFIVRHVAAQQSLDLVAYATADPCFTVRVRVRVFSSDRF